MKRIFWFGMAGGSAFLCDAGMLWLLTTFTPLEPFLGRVIAIAIAMCLSWLVNRSLVFGRSGRSLVHEGGRYGAVSLGGALFNYTIYAASLMLFPALSPVLATAIASACVMFWSWTGYSRFVFR